MKLVLALALLLPLLTVGAQAQNWPGFRGTNASGIADGTHPPTTWNVEKSQNVRWKTTIRGLSHASPIVWGNKVFVITAISSDPKSSFNAKDRGIDLATDDVKHTWRIYCLDKTTGRVLIVRAENYIYALAADSADSKPSAIQAP